VRLIAVLMAVGITACGAKNSLEGSIDESYSLEFDRVQIRRQNRDLLIEYLKDITGGTQKILKIVVETEDLQIDNGVSVSDDDFREFVFFDRVLSSTRDQFPPVANGEIKFNQWQFVQDGRIDGHFSVIFDTGRNMRGNFDALIDVVDTD